MIGRALLACGLAGLVYTQTGVWGSDAALWTHARDVAPKAPRVWIGLAWVAVDEGRDADADSLLFVAEALAERQRASERAWVLDAVGATRATLHLRRGRLDEAAELIAGAPDYSERWALCQRYPAVCARSADSSR